MNDYPRIIPRAPVSPQKEPATWETTMTVMTMVLCAGVIMWATWDNMTLWRDRTVQAQAESVGEANPPDVMSQIRQLERLIAETRQLNADLRALDAQIRKGMP